MTKLAPAKARSQDRPADGGDFSQIPTSHSNRQPAPERRYEGEADRIGLQVARHDSTVDRQAEAPSGRLPAKARAPAERLLGQDFSSVRLHADASAGAEVQAQGAVAVTRGRTSLANLT